MDKIPVFTRLLGNYRYAERKERYLWSSLLGFEGARFENLVACHLLKHVHWQQDTLGKNIDMHYLRTKDGAEVDFALSDSSAPEPTLTHLVECKLSATKLHPALVRFSERWPQATAVQIVRDLDTAEDLNHVQLRSAAEWLGQLS